MIRSTTSIESPALAKHRLSFVSFSPVGTTETDATQVSTETGNKKENYDVAAAQLVPKIVVTEATVEIDAIEVNKILAAVETIAETEIADESVKEEAPKEAPKQAPKEANLVAKNIGAPKVETPKVEPKAVSPGRGSKLSIAERIATLGVKVDQENDRSTKRLITKIRVDVAKEIAKFERISKVAELEPEPKIETDDSKNSTDLLQKIDSKILVQAGNEYALSLNESLKENTNY